MEFIKSKQGQAMASKRGDGSFAWFSSYTQICNGSFVS